MYLYYATDEILKKIRKLTFWDLTYWELTFWEVDILRVDILGVDILGVDILGRTHTTTQLHLHGYASIKHICAILKLEVLIPNVVAKTQLLSLVQ